MNKTILTILGVLTLAAMPAMAVPSGINYQGALTDDQGNPVTGTREMSIKLYDAATGGTLLYSEDIGTVDVSDGVFSFEFGTSGTSNAEQSDTVAIADGAATTFQKVLSASEIVAGSVSVTDGTYTWSQSGGSSNEDNFGVAYSTSLRRVSVTYFNGAPAVGRTITATYRTPASGISGALAGDNQPWAEITMDGVAQIPRQKLLSVPFARVAVAVQEGGLSRSKAVDLQFRPRPWPVSTAGLTGAGQVPAERSFTYTSADYVKRIKSVTLAYTCVTETIAGNTRTGTVAVRVKDSQGIILKSYILQDPVVNRTVSLDIDVDVAFGDFIQIEFVSRTGSFRGFQAYYETGVGHSTIHSASFVADVPEAATW
jgi:hypothetical protein